MDYSSDDIAAARSFQFATVCPLVDMRANNSTWQLVFHQYIYSAYCPNFLFFTLTYFSVDGCILGRLILIYLRPLLISLIQVYDYACSLHGEVLHPFRNTPGFWYSLYALQSGHFCFDRTGTRWKACMLLHGTFHLSFSPQIYIVRPAPAHIAPMMN